MAGGDLDGSSFAETVVTSKEPS